MKQSKLWRVLALLLAFGLVAAACGDSDDAESGDTTEAESSDTTAADESDDDRGRGLHDLGGPPRPPRAPRSSRTPATGC